MKKPGKYLRFYLEYVESGVMPLAGLCICFMVDDEIDPSIEMFEPQNSEEAYRFGHSHGWWGEKLKTRRRGLFNAFRQNVVLFCAAMNNEL